MSLTQEKLVDNNFSNNNDHNYLHKKFKKMATTISVFPPTQNKSAESRLRETDVAQAARDSSISNGSIAAAHPEIEKIKDKQSYENKESENNVQIKFNNDSFRINDVNNVVHATGQTSSTEEFSNKTENNENDFVKETHNGATGGRYICPYCKLSCAKPSVLQKHIRAHTNERPYPCIPCGFAFKTKSNLYKHRRSRTHALRLQGADVSAAINDDDLSGGSESDTSLPPTSLSDTGSETSTIRLESFRPTEFSSPELIYETTVATHTSATVADNRPKSIYKPKFRAAFYQETDEKDRLKRSLSKHADFLTEHISKIISDNEAIVDVIDTPLQKKYGKIKQIAESKQFLNENEIKSEQIPLNLTKQTSEFDGVFRKRSHSESFTNIDNQKHPLNPEGSIIKDLLLKTKANAMAAVNGELVDGAGSLFVCPLCQIIYRSAENLEVHRAYYCKGSNVNNTTTVQKDIKVFRPENLYVRSNSINVRLPETQPTVTSLEKSMHIRNKPDNLVIVKPECSDVIAPLPSPGPLLGNTRLVDTRASAEFNMKSENLKTKALSSPKRKIESRSETYSPRLVENVSPRNSELYPQSKIRCIEASSSVALTSLDDHIRHNSTSLQMFGGEVKIVDHLGSTTTLRIEPSKNQLSPILIHQNLSPSKLGNDVEASSVVVRSGLHSGGTIVHNPPTPKEVIGTPQPQTPRVSTHICSAISTTTFSDMTHFQFPPLSAITAFNPLTLPPLSPSSSPSGASTILHGGKLIPHVPGIPGPTTPGILISNGLQTKNVNCDTSKSRSTPELAQDGLLSINIPTMKIVNSPKYDQVRSQNFTRLNTNVNKNTQNQDNVDIEKYHYVGNIPLIKVKNVEESNVTKTFNYNKPAICKQENILKRTSDGLPKTLVLKENVNFVSNKPIIKEQCNSPLTAKQLDGKSQEGIRHFNFENLITKAEIYNNQIPSSSDVQKNTNAQDTPTTTENETEKRSETAYFQKSIIGNSKTEERKPKFLRPSTLPLKPGTFTPKKHHGITPNANTMPLVSPETPRPAKAYGQLYLNGNAYTYLGLKCSTKVFYCTINRPQPTYVPNQHFLSMYSNWQLLSELTPDPLGLSTSSAMSLYDSRHRPQNVSVTTIKQDLILTHSSQWKQNAKDNKQILANNNGIKLDENKCQFNENAVTPKKELAGGFESNEEYTYVRGRGRGRYVCSECGIRCKKPSMLKKHIRTHTDVRPFTCVHCAFSFKTKGNLTKHMKSKAHYKKCCELGINPNEGNDNDGGELAQSGETDDDTESDGDEGNEGETESSDTEISKSRLPEHEAAHCLLSLGGARPATSATPGLITSARPSTYPYAPVALENVSRVESSPHKLQIASVDSRSDTEIEPMDLSKSEAKTASNITEIPTARESSVLASLASNTAKLPLQQTQWANGEPMLHTYLTERALQDSKIKQSQLTGNPSKQRRVEIENSLLLQSTNALDVKKTLTSTKNTIPITVATIPVRSPAPSKQANVTEIVNKKEMTASISSSKEDSSNVSTTEKQHPLNSHIESNKPRTPNNSNKNNAENAKHVVSEYLKQARINLIKAQDDSCQNQIDTFKDESSASVNLNKDEIINEEHINEQESIRSSLDHDPIARKVVIGAGGVAFKVTKGREFENATYAPGRLMEDGRRVCDFCNKTFTKPSQLRLHLNIHYMERPFRCSVCAVSFRTRGHLQKHERSGSHHNKVSMTSTFGAATSFNPRPFRCSDCNIAFRIHGHLAKHLRSKMHVMRLECLFKLPFGTFTEIERAGVSLTDIDTTDCASSLASLQSLARKLHEKDPSKLEFRDPNSGSVSALSGRDSSDDEETAISLERPCDSDKDSETIENNESQQTKTQNYSATDN